MRPQDRATARRQLDKRLDILQKSVDTLARPPRGWVRAIREALGMTTAQLSRRLGVSQPRVVAIEKAETTGSITMDSLERAARALDCRLVYAFVPRKSLNDLVMERITIRAKNRLKATSHTMKLEAQGVEDSDEQEQLKRLINKLVEKSGSELWEDS